MSFTFQAESYSEVPTATWTMSVAGVTLNLVWVYSLSHQEARMKSLMSWTQKFGSAQEMALVLQGEPR